MRGRDEIVDDHKVSDAWVLAFMLLSIVFLFSGLWLFCSLDSAEADAKFWKEETKAFTEKYYRCRDEHTPWRNNDEVPPQ